MMRLPVRSRRWNLALAVLGAIYAVSAVVLLVWFALDVWNAEAITDRLLQAVLLMSAVCGILLAVSAIQNLGRNAKPWPAEHRQPLASTPPR